MAMPHIIKISAIHGVSSEKAIASSATATVGLTRDLTPHLNAAGKMIIIGTMYLGRVGPISLALALNSGKKHQNIIKNPTEEISVG